MPDPAIWQQPVLSAQPGRPRQLSSHGRDERGSDFFGTRPLAARRKRILLEPGESHVMADLGGAGLVTRIWMTTLWPLRRHTLDDAVLRFWWDGEPEPSVEIALGDFFGAPFGNYRAYQSAMLGITSGGFNCRFPMPFAQGARITVTNESDRVIDPIYFSITYQELPAPPPTDLRFHARWNRQNPTDAGQPYTILEVDGAGGHYVGARLDMQARHWWLRRSFAEMAFPHGFGFGMLEGVERVRIDGETDPSIVGTGTEDFFGAAWYYTMGTFSAPTHGCTVRDWVRGRVSAYRFDVDAPIPFRESIRVMIDHGIDSCIPTDYCSVAYWYQPEPHRPVRPLPPSSERRRRSWATQAVQTVPILSAIAAAAALGVRRVVRRRRG